MSDIRKQIHNKITLLGKDIKNNHISELQNHNDLEKRIIRTDLLDFDYSKQRINDQSINYLLQIPDLINLKDSLNSLFREFFKSDYDSALFICLDVEGISFKDITRTAYQKSIQGFLKKWSDESRKYKALCLSPYEDFTAAGEATRGRAPYFLINVAGRKEISDSHKKLKETKYFDNFSEEERKKLKV